MNKIFPHISVKNAKKTIKAYETLFKAVIIDHMPFDPKTGTEMGFPENYDYANSTMHAVVEISGAQFYIADSMGQPESGGPVEIVILVKTKEDLEAIWEQVKSMNLTIVMELETQFWGDIYGRFVDQDGIGWQLNHTQKQT